MLVGKVDYEERSYYEFQLVAHNKKQFKYGTIHFVAVNILDENDNVPYFLTDAIKIYVSLILFYLLKYF